MAAETITHENEAPTLDALLERVGHDEIAARALTDEAYWKEFAANIEAAIECTPSTVQTDAQRDAIRSAAHKVARIKGSIDKRGLALTKDLREQVTAMNKRRDARTEHLDAAKERVRKPLTEWENAEETRKAERDALTERLNAAAVVTIDMTADAIAARLTEIEALTISDNLFQGPELEQLRQTRERTLTTLKNAHQMAREREEREAEHAKLKADAERRQREEDERQRKVEADERQRQAPTLDALLEWFGDHDIAERALTDEAPMIPAKAADPAPALDRVDPLTETTGDLLAVADRAGLPLSPGLARKLAGACAEGRIRNIRWEG